jgi:hypothetical protein
MLGPGRYLLGVLEILWLAGFATLGGLALRRRLVPDLTAVPAHLATAVLALALLLWPAELLGTFGAFDPVPYLLAVGVAGVACWVLPRGWHRKRGAENENLARRPPSSDDGPPGPHPPTGPAGRGVDVATLIALAIAALAAIHFAAGIKARLSTGMTGFDSTWYHGPFAAGFFQSGDTWDLHFIAPQFLAWFYPANSEVFHAIGMLAFDRDVLSPLLNLGWFVGCLVAVWCIGRPYGVAPWSLALGSIALSVPALSDQAGEARNDIVAIFFLLAAVAIALNAWASSPGRDQSEQEQTQGVGSGGRPRLGTGALIVVGLTVGLAAGTKLNFLLPGAVLVFGLVAVAPKGGRLRALTAAGLAALAGGGYWYLRNLAHTGNPLPWFDHLGPISLPAPSQALGGREAHDVLGYLTDGGVWSNWFLPGLHHGLTVGWPLLLGLSLAGLLLCLSTVWRVFAARYGRDRLLWVAALAGLATALAWLIAPTSASGPDGMPHGFESGLRYLAPALILGLALLPTAPQLRDRLSALGSLNPRLASNSDAKSGFDVRPWLGWVVFAGAVLVVAIGYPIQRHYLKGRYADPSFAAPGLNAAFAWARNVSDARIATTSTRQYPLFGTDLSNHVQFIGEERPHGGFVAPSNCRAWRRLLNEGDYDYVIATRDRLEPGKPPYPETARWTADPNATVVLRRPPTVVFELKGRLDPSVCRG